MNHLDLFSGIGGFALAASRVWPDHNVVAFVENADFPKKVLRKHWPEVPIYGDIKKFNAKGLLEPATGGIDLLTGGFP